MSNDLHSILHADNGIVSFIGAGGKKTTMFRLAEQYGGRVGITATAHIEFFPKELKATNYIGDEDALLSAVNKDKSSKAIAFARPSSRFGRRAGIHPDMAQRFYDEGEFDLLLIKADGARGKFIKAPAEYEPALSSASITVIPVVSAQIIGQPLNNEIAHRVDQICKITGLKDQEEIKPVHIARLITDKHGLLKSIHDSAMIIPLINMVDDAKIEKEAKLVATLALQMTDSFDQVILAAMKKDKPIVDVVTR